MTGKWFTFQHTAHMIFIRMQRTFLLIKSRDATFRYFLMNFRCEKRRINLVTWLENDFVRLLAEGEVSFVWFPNFNFYLLRNQPKTSWFPFYECLVFVYARHPCLLSLLNLLFWSNFKRLSKPWVAWWRKRSFFFLKICRFPGFTRAAHELPFRHVNISVPLSLRAVLSTSPRKKIFFYFFPRKGVRTHVSKII